jgi:phage gp46-like protein
VIKCLPYKFSFKKMGSFLWKLLRSKDLTIISVGYVKYSEIDP